MKKLIIPIAILLLTACKKEDPLEPESEVMHTAFCSAGLSANGHWTINGVDKVILYPYQVKKGDVLKLDDTGVDQTGYGWPPPIYQGITGGEIVVDGVVVRHRDISEGDTHLTYIVP